MKLSEKIKRAIDHVYTVTRELKDEWLADALELEERIEELEKQLESQPPASIAGDHEACDCGAELEHWCPECEHDSATSADITAIAGVVERVIDRMQRNQSRPGCSTGEWQRLDLVIAQLRAALEQEQPNPCISCEDGEDGEPACGIVGGCDEKRKPAPEPKVGELLPCPLCGGEARPVKPNWVYCNAGTDCDFNAATEHWQAIPRSSKPECRHGKPLGDDCGLCDLGPAFPRLTAEVPAPEPNCDTCADYARRSGQCPGEVCEHYRPAPEPEGEELLPCPLCGSEAFIFSKYSPDDEITIACDNDDCCFTDEKAIWQSLPRRSAEVAEVDITIPYGAKETPIVKTPKHNGSEIIPAGCIWVRVPVHGAAEGECERCKAWQERASHAKEARRQANIERDAALAELANFKEVNRELSGKYLNIRGIVGAWKTKPGGSDRFELTERLVREAVEGRDAALAELEAVQARAPARVRAIWPLDRAATIDSPPLLYTLDARPDMPDGGWATLLPVHGAAEGECCDETHIAYSEVKRERDAALAELETVRKATNKRCSWCAEKGTEKRFACVRHLRDLDAVRKAHEETQKRVGELDKVARLVMVGRFQDAFRTIAILGLDQTIGKPGLPPHPSPKNNA